MLSRPAGDGGQITLLVIAYAVIVAALVIVGVDASAAFLARQSLAAAGDAAALDAAQAVDRAAIYTGAGLRCGALLPLDPVRAADSVNADMAADSSDLTGSFTTLEMPETTVSSGTVTVRLSGRAHVPFGRVLAWFAVGHSDGTVEVSVVAHAQSPTALPAGC
jgi:uncharacterized membrane protein